MTTRDRGEASAQLVILTPLLVLLVFLGVQTALYFHSVDIAAAAAAQGAAAMAPSGATPAAGVDHALQTVSDLGGHATEQPRADVIARYVHVTVRVSVSRIVPFFPSSVARSATQPQERFVPESQR